MIQQNTVRENLKVLPLQKRLQAIENTRVHCKETYYRFQDALDLKIPFVNTLVGVFVFSTSRQGTDYWWEVHNKYFKNGK